MNKNKLPRYFRSLVLSRLKQGESISKLSTELKISRKTIYNWQKKYSLNGESKPAIRYRIAKNKSEKVVLFEVAARPQLSLDKLNVYLKTTYPRWKKGRTWLQQLLNKLNLSLKEQRIEFSKQYTRRQIVKKSIPQTMDNLSQNIINTPQNSLQSFQSKIKKMTLNSKQVLSEKQKLSIISFYTQGIKVNEICAKCSISRKSYYNWLKSLREQGHLSLDNRGRPETTDPRIVDFIKDLVKINPLWDADKLHQFLNVNDQKPIISRTTVYRILRKLQLNTVEARKVFSYKSAPLRQVPAATTSNEAIYHAEHQRVNLARGDPDLIAPHHTDNLIFSSYKNLLLPKLQILAHFINNNISNQLQRLPVRYQPTAITVHQFIINNPKQVIISAFIAVANAFVFSKFAQIIIEAGSFAKQLGLTLSSIALFCGIFFFLYSVKYYITIFSVIFTSQTRRKDGRYLKPGKIRLFFNQFGLAPLLDKIFGKPYAPINEVDPLSVYQEVQNVALRRYPFFSIQIAMYNEKKVADRVVSAAAAMDYPNFEVLVCDDSTDETTEILRQKWGDNPKVKIIHRDNRAGFKGTALSNALNHMNPKTDYVVVFDADFVPYPDTLTLFAKYYQVFSKLENQNAKELFENDSRYLNNVTTHNKPALNFVGKTVAIQGYQWHVLNKSENWISRAVRTEFSGSYVIERSGGQIFGLLKQIAGSVYSINAQVLRSVGWGTSLTEDFQLTLKLYEQGFKVAYTPYIQAPSECVSTLKRLIKQRQRWAEGHSFNIKHHLANILNTPLMTRREKWEAIYLAPYYIQSLVFIVGTLSWLIAESVLKTNLPFWTQTLGWSLIITNLFSLPLMNATGVFLEEGEEKDFLGILSFMALSYILAPYVGFAALKGFLEKQEGPWFRTPKSGRITNKIERFSDKPGRVSLFGWIKGRLTSVKGLQISGGINYLTLNTASNRFNNFHLTRKQRNRLANFVIVLITSTAVILTSLSGSVPVTSAENQAEYLTKTQQQLLSQPDHKEEPPEITSPHAVQKHTRDGSTVEFIFYKNAKVRLKISNHEIELTTIKIGDTDADPQKAYFENNNTVIYKDIVKNIDLKYTITGDLMVEEFIIHDKYAASQIQTLKQEMRTQDVKIVSPDSQSFGFYDKEGKELFKFTQPYLKDQLRETSEDIKIKLEHYSDKYLLTKTIGSSGNDWLFNPERSYPVILDPSVVVTGGIAETETQFGGLQRKVTYLNNNYYAFYNDAGGIYYKKSSDGTNWDSAVQLDTDTDNYNPSISISGNTIVAFWIDDGVNGTDTADSVQGRVIDTASSDTQGPLCTSIDQGTLDNTNFVTLAAMSSSRAVVAFSDSSTDSEFNVYDITGLDGTCAFGTDLTPGNINAGSGLTAGDRPVLVAYNSTDVGMVFQDGDLSYSLLDVDSDAWTTNNLTIATVTDNVYSVITDGTKMWVLTVSGTTSTNFYSCCTSDFTVTQIDSDAGANGQDNLSNIDLSCPTSDNCKIIYTDDLDTSAPRLIFVDCDNETCTSSTTTVLDSDIGDSGDQAGASIDCYSGSNDCKIAYGDDMDTTAPTLKMIDCNNETCSSSTVTTVDSDLGDSSATLQSTIACNLSNNCKILYNDSGLQDLLFIDCGNNTCSTIDATTTLDSSAGTYPKNDMFCYEDFDCKIVYHDSPTSDFTFIDCDTESCNTNTQTDVDGTVGGTTGQVPVSIDCIPGADDCKLVYGDQVAGDMFFVDCGTATCTTTGRTITTIDINGGANASTDTSVSLYCNSGTTCQFTYVGKFTSGAEELNFVDCNGSATCAAGSYKVQQLPSGRFRSQIICPSANNCKLLYYGGGANSDPTVLFADCSNASCFPSPTTETSPWTGETNVTSVSLSYVTGSSQIYAHVIKDSTEQAYYKTTSTSSISWGSQSSWAFTGGDLGHISATETVATGNYVSVVVRSGSNFEFATLPENLLLALLAYPIYLWYKRKKRKKQKW